MRSTQLKSSYDIAIAGSGFAGSLMAMIARRLGYSVMLLERGRHPRTVIGESSTPLANLLFEELCQRYELPALAPLAKWGTWQRTYPHIGCGLKRGFSFYHHPSAAPDDPSANFATQLLVAASPHDEIGDTHWYRADFDALLVEHAQQIGVDYADETRVETVLCKPDGVRLAGTSCGAPFSFDVRFLIDATGPRGLLQRGLKLRESELRGYPQTQALWSHFEGVARPTDSTLGVPPYSPQDAAVHQLFDGGWIWVLRFNNGITSAGVAVTDAVAGQVGLTEGEPAWRRLLSRMPHLQTQFSNAHAVEPFRHIPRLASLSEQVVGESWAMLPSAAGFVDPLLSTGFPLTLLGIERLAKILESGLDAPSLPSDLEIYAQKTKDELSAAARLIAALYANMDNFAVFRALTLLYFAAASYSEAARRLHKPHLATSFLLHDHAIFGASTQKLLERAIQRPIGCESAQFICEIQQAITPFDIAGLSKPNARNWYPVAANDLLDGCAKVESTPAEIEALLQACGFYPAGQPR
ncbi:MAG TPA: tryptophan 7-halogenase [Terracidiphilus sp.]|nr:tryptophan 7-halogenase [Terracidiphilus sp.]